MASKPASTVRVESVPPRLKTLSDIPQIIEPREGKSDLIYRVSGDKEGKGGIYNFVTKRGNCLGDNSKISWTQVETGSAVTWKYPSVIMRGDNSVGEFYSVAVTKNKQQADTGTKMIHIGKNTKSTIITKGISAGEGQNTYRGGVKILKRRILRLFLVHMKLLYQVNFYHDSKANHMI